MLSNKEERLSLLVNAISRNDADSVRKHLNDDVDPLVTDVQAPKAWQWIRRRPQRNSLLHDAVFVSSQRRDNGDSLDVVRLLLDHGCSISSTNNDGFTPLHCAALVNHAPAAQLLVFHGADVNCQSTRKYTPFHIGIAMDSIEALSVLAHFGASTNILNDRNEDALVYAIRKRNGKAQSMVKSLRAKKEASLILCDLTKNVITTTPMNR